MQRARSMRYDAESLHGEFGEHFRLVESAKELLLRPARMKSRCGDLRVSRNCSPFRVFRQVGW
jgi:hypothetical protein